MKVLLIKTQTNPKQSLMSFKGNQVGISSLTGLDAVKKHKKDLEKIIEKEALKKNEVTNVIYNSIDSLAEMGQYNAFKILFKELEDEIELKNDYLLYKTAADVYKKTGEVEKANELYKNAYDNVPASDPINLLAIQKNYIETKNTSDINAEEIAPLLKYKEILPNITYLELNSVLNLINLKDEEYKNDIKAAYWIAKNNGLENEELETKFAVVLTAEEQYEKSAEFCNNKLNELKEKNKIYTKEFAFYLNLLGINKLEATNEDSNKIKNVFKNVIKISEKIQDNGLKESASYNLVRLYFTDKDNGFLKEAKDFLLKVENEKYRANVNIMIGDYCQNVDKDISLQAYYSARDILLSEKNQQSEKLLHIYENIKTILPEKTSIIEKEIIRINDKSIINISTLSNSLGLAAEAKDWIKVRKLGDEVFKNEKSEELNKQIAQTYLIFANIDDGNNFEKNVELLNDNLKKISLEFNKNKENKALAKHLFNSYSHQTSMLYDSSRYNQASESFQKTQDLLAFINPTKEDISESKIRATMISYKAKNYLQAEKNCLEYLKLLQESTPNNIDLQKDSASRKIAAAYETLGVINMKNKNFEDSKKYFQQAIGIREKLKNRDLHLANSYAALARIAVITDKMYFAKGGLSSKNLHSKSLEILREKYRDNEITKDEEEFHKKYYGFKWGSVGKFMPFRNKENIIDKFQCYNSELSICE